MKNFEELWNTIDGLFWLAIAGGILVKLTFSETKMTKRQVASTIIAGVFCAVFLSKPLLDLLKLDGEHFEYGIVALLALTGEHVVRRVVKFSQSGSINDVKKGLTK